jgi:hypothetical protein
MRKIRDVMKHIGHIISPKLGSSSARTQPVVPETQQTREELPLSSVPRPNLLHHAVQLHGPADQEKDQRNHGKAPERTVFKKSTQSLIPLSW